MNTKTTTNRDNNLNIIRFIAAVMVIYGHMNPLLGLGGYSIFNQAISTVGVKIFFVISGYLITQSWMNDGKVLTYGLKRFFRIMPGLIVLTFITAFIIGPLVTDVSVAQYFGEFKDGVIMYLKNALLYPIYSLPGVFDGNIYQGAVNGSLWTLPIEVAMYVLLPIVIVLFKKLGNYKIGIVLIFVVSLVANSIKLHTNPAAYYVVYGTNVCDALNLVPYFFIGAIFTFDRVKKCLNLQIASILMLILASLNVSLVKMEMLFVFVLPYFVFSFGLAPNPVFSKFGRKVDLSYGMYLYGFVIQQILVKYMLKYNLSVNVFFVISTIVTLICATFSWYLVEKPAQNLGKFLVKKYNNFLEKKNSK